MRWMAQIIYFGFLGLLQDIKIPKKKNPLHKLYHIINVTPSHLEYLSVFLFILISG